MPTITYSTTKPTNKNVVATVTFDKEGVIVEGATTHTFTENGKYEFKYTGPAGNKGIAVAEVTWIDKKVPEAIISYNPTNPTNKDVTATIDFDEEDVKITNNGGKNTHKFTTNGTFKFEFIDKAGNKGTATAVVNIIDKKAPTAEIKYSTTIQTNNNVTVTLVNPSESITITNNNGKNTYVFKENGTFIFEFVDRVGNKGTATAVVNNINKVAPTAKVTYSTTSPTNQNVVATLTGISKDITITNNNGKNVYTFTKNGSFTFEFVDKAGNKGTVTAVVNNIDRIAPTAKVTYSTTNPTNKNVTVALKNASEEIRITNNNGKDTYIFAENGTFTFEFVDKAGNKGTVTAVVNNIDRIAPTAKIKYNTIALTNKDVVANLIDASEEITIINNGGKNAYTFTKNGTFTFEFVDKAGNKGTATAVVNNIDKVAPTAKIKYSTTADTNQDVIVSLVDASEEIKIINNNGKNTYTFTKNGVFTFEFIDKAGNKGTATAIVNNIKKVSPKAKVVYSTTKATNKDVIATLTDLDKGVVITNNGGKNTYTFKENGTFTFEFVDKAGNVGSLVAIVENIDKIAPTAQISYTPSINTTGTVVAKLEKFSEEVTLINNGGKYSYVFTKNGTFTFEFVDKAGNKGTAVAKVTWINESIPTNPEKPSTITKPSTPSGSNNQTTKPIIVDSNKNTTNNVNSPINIESSYKTYKIGRVTLKVPANYWVENTELKIKYLELSSTIQEELGGDNEYFELYIDPFTNINSNGTITMIIDVEKEKTLLGFYRVTNNKTIESLDYKELGDNKIEVQVNSLGEFLLSYEDDEEITEDPSDDEENNIKFEKVENKDEDKKINTRLIIIIIILLDIAAVIVLKSKKGKNIDIEFKDM